MHATRTYLQQLLQIAWSASATMATDDARLDRLNFLWTSAHAHAHESPALARVLLLGMQAYAADEELPLPPRIAQRFCAGCFSVLTPGLDCTATRAVHPRRPPIAPLRRHVATSPLTDRHNTHADGRLREGQRDPVLMWQVAMKANGTPS